jgi:hypothetical protein
MIGLLGLLGIFAVIFAVIVLEVWLKDRAAGREVALGAFGALAVMAGFIIGSILIGWALSKILGLW